ncbi:MAG TPA: EAL domain-containing protein [Candidatus Levilactobacillus faecigallinarum]|uniref:EAL domain-containing protein n=1 Tax=Candidatus Levilactobacillus faecigallinarum TaxID=2838638 RepID=A0A9D1QQD1_9LACO|nr:EAL domain-containing protein [Candidatus Levilactobacillus faecigallinarum]
MSRYRFFVQPQIDQHSQQVIGYEALLRQHQDGGWILPRSFTAISVTDQVKLLEQTAARLNIAATNQTIAFNLNNQQFRDPFALGAIITFKKRFANVHLSIELTEAPALAEITLFSTVLHQYDIKLVIDDVGTGSNTYGNIQHLLPFVDEIKFAMQNLRAEHNETQIPTELAFWSKIAQTYRMGMILEGVENASDQALAHRYGITLHQGYLYGKPSLV